MKFTVLGNKIVCSREENSADGNAVYRRVVEFDAQVGTVPPHVAGKLEEGEIAELERFVIDRRSIQDNSADKNLLEALPGLLREAAAALRNAEHVNSAIFKQLTASMAEMSIALEQVKTVSNDSPTPTQNMRESEAQKERLQDIKLNT